MIKEISVILSITLIFTMPGVWIKASMAQEIPLISKEKSKELLSRADVMFVDARPLDQDAKTFESWTAKYPKDKTYVFYCG